MRTRYVVVLALLAAPLGACSRSFPSTFPPSSAASSQAAEAPAAVVGRALVQEPPLPGEPTDGWIGLEPDAAQPASQVHSAHAAHGGDDAR